jgi:hypothetical protein
MKHHSDLLKSSRRTTCPTRAEDFTEPRFQKNGSGSPVTTMKSVPSVEFGAHISSLGSPRYYKNISGQKKVSLVPCKLKKSSHFEQQRIGF